MEGAVTAGSETRLRPEVGYLQIVGGCTATLITERHFLTAAHCINSAPMHRGGTFTIDLPGGGERAFQVDRAMALTTSRTGDSDMAVGRLVDSVPASVARPARISTVQAQKGWHVSVIGYGGDALGGPSGVKRYRDFRLTGADRVLEGGDSGGPVFGGSLEWGGDLLLVNSATRHGPIITDKDIWANPVRLKAEIDSLVAAFEGTGICYRYNRSGLWSCAYCDGAPTPSPQTVHGMQIWTGSRSNAEACFSVYLSPGQSAGSVGAGWSREYCAGEGAIWGNGFFAGKYDGTLRNLRVRLTSAPRNTIARYHNGDIRWSGGANDPMYKEPGFSKNPYGFAITRFAVFLVDTGTIE